MGHRRRYRKKKDQFVVAVQLKLDTEGFTYRKWGGRQQCKPDDWLVDNQGDVYTVDREVFARTYRRLRPGMYIKATPVWAEQATEPGVVATKEGESHYEEGDYLVFNNEDGTDGYCMSVEKFESVYEPDE